MLLASSALRSLSLSATRSRFFCQYVASYHRCSAWQIAQESRAPLHLPAPISVACRDPYHEFLTFVVVEMSSPPPPLLLLIFASCVRRLLVFAKPPSTPHFRRVTISPKLAASATQRPSSGTRCATAHRPPCFAATRNARLPRVRCCYPSPNRQSPQSPYYSHFLHPILSEAVLQFVRGSC